MYYSVDVEHEYQTIKSKLFRISLLFAVILTFVLLADVLLVALSKEDYLVCMIISIVITVIFIWFAIYFFTNVWSDINNQYRYFKGYESGLHPTEEVEFIYQDEELTYVNGLCVYRVHVRYISNLDAQEKIVYSLKSKLPYDAGDKLTVTTYQRVIMASKRHK